MKAVYLYQHGGPEVLKYEDTAEPAIRANEVLVRVRACALNHLDLWLRAGIPGARLAMPHILGSDISGDVVAVGDLCHRVKPGMRAILAPGLSCRQCRACVSGQDNLCREYTLFGAGVPGGNCELIASPEYAVIPIGGELKYEEAAAAPLVFQTAWHMLTARAQLEFGEDVLVLAASSGVGMAAVQIAKMLHCRVIATAGGDEKLAKAKELGSDFVIDHYRQDIAEEVKRITGRRGVNVVIEHIGAATWAKSLASLATGGRLVTCGATTGFDAGIDLRYLFSKQQSVLGSYMGTLGELHRVMQFVIAGQLKPVIDSVFDLSQAAEAHRRLESKAQFGKIVLRV